MKTLTIVALLGMLAAAGSAHATGQYGRERIADIGNPSAGNLEQIEPAAGPCPMSEAKPCPGMSKGQPCPMKDHSACIKQLKGSKKPCPMGR